MAPSRAPSAEGVRRGALHSISLDAKVPAVSLPKPSTAFHGPPR